MARLIQAKRVAADGKIRSLGLEPSATAIVARDENLPREGIAPKKAGVQPFKIQRKDTCSNSSSDEAIWAGQNEGKVFKSGDKSTEPNEVILWNYCVSEKTLR
ncbi:MAG TPA: hypothetical protein VIU43_02990, partial [Nitrosospira sp.]